MKNLIIVSLIGIGLIAALVLMRSPADGPSESTATTPAGSLLIEPPPDNGKNPPSGENGSRNAGPEAADGVNADGESLTEEDKVEAAEEANVEAFDNLTDKWMEPAKAGIAMSDVEAFARAFRHVPKARQDECVHRALNLIPDENVMLLAGILMDKSMNKDIVETVFNDILNRSEDVKEPIMKQIFKDKTHPCWADVAWILDVTGENGGNGKRGNP